MASHSSYLFVSPRGSHYHYRVLSFLSRGIFKGGTSLVFLLLAGGLYCPSSSALVPEICAMAFIQAGGAKFITSSSHAALSPEDRVFLAESIKQIRKNPHWAEGVLDWDRIERLGLTKTLRRYQSLLSSFDKSWLFFLFASAGVVVADAGLTFVGEEGKPNSECDEDIPSESQIDLIVHSPMNHMSLRIGETFYDFGPNSGGKYTLEQFRKWTTAQMPAGKYQDSTRIRLNIGVGNKKLIRADLEKKIKEESKVFYAVPIQTCVSLMNAEIEDCAQVSVPAGIDHVPSYTKTWFKLKKAMGSKQIEKIQYCFEGSPAVTKAKQMGINAVVPGLLMPWVMTDLAIVEKNSTTVQKASPKRPMTFSSLVDAGQCR